MKVETVAEQLFFSTVRMEVDGGVATSFVVRHSWQPDKQGSFLVTNKHVLLGAKQALIFFTASDGSAARIGQKINVTLGELEGGWTGHPDDSVDVAVIPLAPLIAHLNQKGQRPFIKAVPTALIPTPAQFESELDAIEEILFVGYPSGIYDTKNLLPIARRGTTASPMSVDYNGKPMFLIDASVFPGSSGSPVFIHNAGSYPARGGGMVVGSRVFLLGIVSAVLFRDEDGTLDFVDIPTALVPRVRTKQMIDLGVVFKASTIVETIEALLKARAEL